MIEVHPLTPAIVAEIRGIDLGRPCDAGTLADIEKVFLDHKVLVFRDQAITTDQHVAFCRQLGDLEVHPFAPHKPDHPEVMVLWSNERRRGSENFWHSDVTWRTEPSLGSMLRAVTIPPVGGDTLFANMEMAYESLPDELRRQVDDMTAVHDFTRVFGRGKTPEEIAELRETYPLVEHPVIRTHPVTGRRSIYVNTLFTSHLVGVEAEESARILRTLYRTAAVPEHQFRLRWAPDTFALWDNRCVQHYATSDYHPQERVMERVTIVGDRPF